MNILYLKRKIDEIIQNHPDPNSLEVVVPIMGMGGAHEKVKGVGLGFDWYSGCVCLETEERLCKKVRE